jgi:hypothetical protein
MLEYLYTKIKSENYDMVCCDFFFEDDLEITYKRQDIGNRTNIDLIKKIITWENFWDFLPVTWNKLVRAEIYKMVNFPKITYSEDRAIMVQVLYYCGKIGYINKGLYHWCRIEKSASRADKRKIQNLIEDYISYTAILLFIVENRINTDELTKEIINHIDYMGFLCRDNKEILDVYKNSLNKIIKLKTSNELTNNILLSEQKNTGKLIKKLDKRNSGKKIVRVLRAFKNLF